MAEHNDELAQRSDLINPWPIWGIEDEDEHGDTVPGPLWMNLSEVTHPVDGSLWVIDLSCRVVMLRKDVLDLAVVPADLWCSPHKPSSWNSLGALPHAVPPQASFAPWVVQPLLPLGVRVLPLTVDEQRQPMAHAIMRGEDWIGYVMSCKPSVGAPLPDALQVRHSPGARTSDGADQ